LIYIPTDEDNAAWFASVAAQSELERGVQDGCKYDDTSTMEYALKAYKRITKEINNNPSLINYVTRLDYDSDIYFRFIDIYASLCPPNLREVEMLMESFTQCAVRVRWLIDFY